MPETDLLQGDAQQILVWVILALSALYFTTTALLLKKLASVEDKYDAQQNKLIKLAVRSQRAIEAVLELPTPAIEETLDEE